MGVQRANRNGAHGRHFAFFSFPGVGHVRPTLPVVSELLARGHQVSYVVADRFGDTVGETGARTIRYPSTFPPALPLVRTVDELAEVTAAYLSEAFAAWPVAWSAFDDGPPDVVVEDALSTAVSRFTAHRFGCPVVRVFPGLAGNDRVPINGSEPEPDSPRLDGEHPVITACYTGLLERLRPYGVDGERLAAIISGGEVAANLVFVPRAFQPHADYFDDSFVFAGPTADRRPAATEWRPPSGRRTVLISLGTSARPNPAFFRECAEAFADSDWHVVMATARHIGPAESSALPGSVETHEWLDYGAVLPHASVVVCQGGAGSLMEAFRHGAPVVVVPQQPDARAAARHVVDLGLGLALLDQTSGTAVRAAVDAVVADDHMRRRVDRMRTAIETSGGSRCAVDVLERVGAHRSLSEKWSDALWS